MRGAQFRLLMTTDAVGGVWQYSTELAGALAEHGFAVVLAVLGPRLAMPQRVQAEALPSVTVIETGLALDWLANAEATRAAADRIAELAREQAVDLVHLNSPALAADAGFNVPVIGVAHGCVSTWWEAARTEPLAPEFHWHRDMTARGLRACDRVIAPTASYAETVRRHYRLALPPKVVANGRTPMRASKRQMQDFAFTAGRLWDEVKNARTLDAVAARLPFPFHAAGPIEAPHGQRVVLEHLHPLGQLDADALSRWLSARPVFVSAARFEPFGLAVLEAAMSGCALVLSDIPTFRELWDGAALLLPPDDAQGFAEAVQELVCDFGLRQQMGEAARERARRYTAERMAARMAGHYRELLAAHVAAA